MAVLCDGGVTLRAQINDRFPNRDKSSDGWVGDTRHQANAGWGTNGRGSYHNPDPNGIVHAIDIDENLGEGTWRNGKAAQRLADQLVAYAASGLPGSDRIAHVVYEDKVASGTYRSSWWKWRGKGYGHTAHIHVSFTNAADHDGRIFPLPILGENPSMMKRWAAALRRRK